MNMDMKKKENYVNYQYSQSFVRDGNRVGRGDGLAANRNNKFLIRHDIM